MLYAQPLAKFAFERFDTVTADVRRILNDGGHCGINFSLVSQVLAVKVYEGDVHLERSCRITDVRAGFGNVFGHHRASANDHIVADGYRKHRRIASDGDAIANFGGLPEGGIAVGRTAFREGVIDEHDAVTDETIVADGHQFANEAVALHLGALAHHDALLNFAEWSHEDPVRQGAFIEVAGFDDCNIFPSV